MDKRIQYSLAIHRMYDWVYVSGRMSTVDSVGFLVIIIQTNTAFVCAACAIVENYAEVDDQNKNLIARMVCNAGLRFVWVKILFICKWIVLSSTAYIYIRRIIHTAITIWQCENYIIYD